MTIRTLSLIAISITLFGWADFATADDRPNIVLLMADDLGYHDLSSFGSPNVKTPHLDKLAADGMRFNQFYAASAVCTPTRASVLTGRYPLRFDIRRHFNDRKNWLPESSTTIAELLKNAGYHTAHVGKWHLGGLHVDEDGTRLKNQPGPGQHGFEFYQTQIEQQPLRGAMSKKKALYRKGGTVLLRNGQRIGEEDPYYSKHFTDANGDMATELIEKFAADDKPFFLNVWWLVPHTPYEPAPAPHWERTTVEGISENQHCFRSMVQHMDAKVGQILAKLDELGIAENTMVVFTSDNGSAYEGFTGELKGGKTDLHEGGLRVPMMVRWPACVKHGQETGSLGHSADLLPTFCQAASVALPDRLKIDGKSLLPHLKGGAPLTDEQRGTVFWQMDLYKHMQRHYPKPEPFATEIARKGKWKMLSLDGEPVELFDTAADPNEKVNLLSQEPELVSTLKVEVAEFLSAPRTPKSSSRTKKDK